MQITKIEQKRGEPPRYEAIADSGMHLTSLISQEALAAIATHIRLFNQSPTPPYETTSGTTVYTC